MLPRDDSPLRHTAGRIILFGLGKAELALRSNGVQALAEEVDEMLSVIFSARNGTALKSRAWGSGTAEACSCSDEFHHLEGDFLIAPQRRGGRTGSGWRVAHGNSPRLN